MSEIGKGDFFVREELYCRDVAGPDFLNLVTISLQKQLAVFAKAREDACFDVCAFTNRDGFADINTALFPGGLKGRKSFGFPVFNPGSSGRKDLVEDGFEIVFVSGLEVHRGGWAVDEGGGGGIHVDVETNADDDGSALGMGDIAAFKEHATDFGIVDEDVVGPFGLGGDVVCVEGIGYTEGDGHWKRSEFGEGR